MSFQQVLSTFAYPISLNPTFVEKVGTLGRQMSQSPPAVVCDCQQSPLYDPADWVHWLTPSFCTPLDILWGTPNHRKSYFPRNQLICRFCDNRRPYKRWPKLLTIGTALQKSSLQPQAPFHGCWGQREVQSRVGHPTWVAHCRAKAGSHRPWHSGCPALLAQVWLAGHPAQLGDRFRSHLLATTAL